MIKVAILDDYQGVALSSADWSPLDGKAEITVFRDTLAMGPSLVERLKPFDAVVAMRERTAFKEPLLAALPNLKLISSTGRRHRHPASDPKSPLARHRRPKRAGADEAERLAGQQLARPPDR